MTTDFTAPVVLHDNAPSTEDFCNRLHKQLMMQFKYAWVWGSSVRHQPQKVRLRLSVCVCAYVCVYTCVCVIQFFLFAILAMKSLSTSTCTCRALWKPLLYRLSSLSYLIMKCIHILLKYYIPSSSLLHSLIVWQRSYTSWWGRSTNC